jgi:hypothetical protein
MSTSTRTPKKTAKKTEAKNQPRPSSGDMEYLGYNPTEVPKGKIVVHNHIKHDKRTRIGVNGFRAWRKSKEALKLEKGHYVRCECDWMDITHYRLHFQEVETKVETTRDKDIRNLADKSW